MGLNNAAQHAAGFERKKLEARSYISEENTIIFPKHIYEHSLALTTHDKGVGGVIIASKQRTRKGTHYLAEHLTFMEKGIFLYNEREDNLDAQAIQQFLEKYEKNLELLHGIEFHVRTAKEVEEEGAKQFKWKELDRLKYSIGNSNPYMHVMFTPTYITRFGIHDPWLAIDKFSHTPRFLKKGEIYEAEIQGIKKELEKENK